MLRVSGTVEIREVQLAPLASGRLARLLKDEGDSTRRGDTVAVLEQPGLDALIAQRRAQAHAAAFRVNEVVGAQADSARAANDLGRAEPLRAQGIVSQQQYDALTAAAAAWGREQGSRWAVLQVALHNTVARAFYDKTRDFERVRDEVANRAAAH